jgi:hypothetical protein
VREGTGERVEERERQGGEMTQTMYEHVNKWIIIKKKLSEVPASHACTPGYLGGRDQEDCGLKSAPANCS